MSVSINTASAQTLSTTDTLEGSIARATALATPDAPVVSNAAPLSIAEQPAFDPTKTAFYEAMNARGRLGPDTQSIASALVPIMQSVIKQRPDLANAKFDFVSSNGSLQVVGDSMSTADHKWLQDKLNGSPALTTAVQAFNSDTVAAYGSGSLEKGDGTGSSDYSPKVSDSVSGSIKFMGLFKSIGNEVQNSTFMSDAKYIKSDGSQLDFHSADPGSASGMLNFMNQVNAAESGLVSIVTPQGKASINYRSSNVFEQAGLSVQSYLPGSSGSLGFSDVA